MERLTRVEVTKLFGNLNHSFDLDLDKGVTILHGANGSGKSTILRTIHEMSESLPISLFSLPFQRFSFAFTSGTELVIKKNGQLQSEVFQDKKPLGTAWQTNKKELTSLKRKYNIIRHSLLNRSAYRYSIDGPELFNFLQLAMENNDEELIEHITKRFKPRQELLFEQSITKRMLELRQNFNCTLIEEQRLLNFRSEKKSNRVFSRTVTDFAGELKSRLSEVLSGYARESQKLDRSYPHRAISTMKLEPPSVQDLREQLLTLSEKAGRFQSAGILDATTVPELSVTDLRRKDVRRLLSTYCTDTEKKLSVLDDIYKKVTLFERLVNEHFTHKKVKVSIAEGLRFSAHNNSVIPPEALSSGEQHLLVLFFRLIFGDLSNGQLVLIDEPELSLHPRWQLRFIDNLMEIRKISKVDFILATHSPQIISSHGDLKRALLVR